MNASDTFLIITDHGRCRVNTCDLARHSEYFRALFDSNMNESRKRRLDLRTNALKSQFYLAPISGKTLKKTLTFLMKEDGGHIKKFRFHKFLKSRSLVFNSNTINDVTSKPLNSSLRRWLLRASDNEIRTFLMTISYFNFLGLINQVETVLQHSIDDATNPIDDVIIASRTLPHAWECGLPRLHEAALKTAAENYFDFLRYLYQNQSQISKGLVSRIKELRHGRGRTNSLSVLLRTDFATSAEGNALTCSYAVVEFRECYDSRSNTPLLLWRPRLIDVFTTDANEHVTQAVSIDNYLYVITVQYCRHRNVTAVRTRRYNPFKSKEKPPSCCTTHNGSKSSSRESEKVERKSQPGLSSHFLDRYLPEKDQPRAWFLGGKPLIKSGFVYGFQAVVARQKHHRHGNQLLLDDDGKFCIFLLGGKKVIRQKRGGKTELEVQMVSDLDCYEPISNMWKKCARTPFKVCNGKTGGFWMKSIGQFPLGRKKSDTNLSVNACSVEICDRCVCDDAIQVRITYGLTSDLRPKEHREISPDTRSLKANVKSEAERLVPHIRRSKNFSYDISRNIWQVGDSRTFSDKSHDVTLFRDFASSPITDARATITSTPSNVSGRLGVLEEVLFTLKIDKTCKNGSDLVQLTRTCKTRDDVQKTDVIYSLPCDTFSSVMSDEVKKDIILSDVENLLANSSLAVPRLVYLYYPYSEEKF